MAIQRCPYCKAIIDEGAEYCTNCGTKLLFPEDEFIDEEIPGEKIIDVDEDISGIQQELKEGTGEIPPAEEEEPGEPPSAEEKEPEEGTSLEAELEDLVPIADVAPMEDEMAEPGEGEALAEEQKSETEQLVTAIEEELVEPEADEPEKKKAAPKKKTPSRKRKSPRKKPAAKKPKKKAAPVKVVEDEEPEPEKPEEPEVPAELEAAAEELEPAAEEQVPSADAIEQAVDAIEPEAPADELDPSADALEAEEATPAAEAEAAAADALEDIEEASAPETEVPIAEETDLDVEPQDIQEEVTEEEAEIRDNRRRLTEDLPEGFAQVIDEARERSGEPLEEFLPQEIEETLEEEEPVPEMLTPEPGTAEEKEWQTPPVGEPLAEPGTQDEQRIQTGDIEDIVDEAEKEKEEIDDFIASIKKERRSVRDQIKSDTQDIPPWAKNVPDGPLPDIPPTDEIVFTDKADGEEQEDAEPVDVEEEKAPEEESSSLVEKDTAEGPVPGYDTRSAFPETVDQQGLPFVKTAEIMGEDIEEDIEEEAPKPKKIRVKRKSHPVGFSDWIRARIFDVVFVSVLWFVALWIASQVIGISVFRVLSGSTPVALLFLGILLLIYFFFFLYFLGETLGNYLFSSDE